MPLKTEFDLGTTSMEQGDIGGALAHFDAYVQGCPDSEDGWLLRAICLARLGRAAVARQSFDDLLAKFPNCRDAQIWLAELCYSAGDLQTALRWAKVASTHPPVKPEVWYILGRCFLRLKQPAYAVDALESAVSLGPDVAHFHHFLGLAYEQAQRRDLAVEHLRRSISLAPRDPKSYFVLASSYSRFGLAGMALRVLTEGLSKIPNDAALHSATAAAFTQIRNYAAAEAHHKRAVELSPEARVAYALWLVDQGKYDEALAIYNALIEEKPRLGASYYGVLQCRKLTKEDDGLLAKMDSLVEDKAVAPVSRMFLSYALGKAREQRQEYEVSMRHYDEANRLAFESLSTAAPFSLEQLKLDSIRVRECYERLRDRGLWGVHDQEPIFIIGMIRSGTTLLDQVVSSHPQVSNAGELRYWIEKGQWLAEQEAAPSEEKLREIAQEYLEYVRHLVGEAERTTDKMPLYFFYSGLIHRAFPNARFLHIKRNPVGTCLSIYTTYFGTGSHFVYDKSNIVAYYREYQTIMDYWRKNVPADRLMELNYEDLVNDRERVVRSVIDFCDLPWDDACLHHEDNKSAINTPSRWQARQPVYKSSLDRWRKFEPWLGEFSELSPEDVTTSGTDLVSI